MCLEKVKQEAPLTAKKDIKCWKVIMKRGEEYLSPYKYAPIKFEKKLVSELGRNIPWLGVEEGFHTFKIREAARWEAKYYNRQPMEDKHIVVKAVIPAGSMYWKGEFRDKVSFCSDTIIYSLPDNKNN